MVVIHRIHNVLAVLGDAPDGAANHVAGRVGGDRDADAREVDDLRVVDVCDGVKRRVNVLELKGGEILLLAPGLVGFVQKVAANHLHGCCGIHWA